MFRFGLVLRAGYCCDASPYRLNSEGVHRLRHFVKACLIRTDEDEYERIAVFHSAKMGAVDVHAIDFGSVVVAERL